MEEMELLAPLAFIIIALIAGAVLKLVLNKINLPYTVGLFILGVIVGVLNMNGLLEATPVISKSITMACDLNPDMILNIFLPILIFSAAYELDVHIFKKTLFNSVLLAVPGLIIAMFLTAALMMGVAHIAPAYSGWSWTFALMFGALISATDPVAVVALLGELGVSKRFSTLIDGESMLNDGTGIVLFMLMFAPFTSSVESTDPSPVISFCVVVFGGLAIGYLMARAFLFYATRSSVKGDALLQTSVMILLSYITFILAQDIFKLSGVIALVMFGLVTAYSGSAKLNEKSIHFMKEFWGLLAYVANTLIFIIMGVIIAEKVDFTWRDIVVLFIVYIGMNLIRMVMVTMLYPIMRRNGYGISKRESLILTWGALRGALALTLALMVSYTESIPEDIRRQVLLLTSGVVTLTLVVNATSIKWLLNRLGLLETSASRKIVAAEVRRKLHAKSQNYIDSLKGCNEFSATNWEQIHPWQDKSEYANSQSHNSIDILASLRIQIISGERQVILNMFNEGEIEIRAKRKLISMLDMMTDRDGEQPLDERIAALGLNREKIKTLYDRFIKRHRLLRALPFGYFMTSAAQRYETTYAVLKAQQRAQEILDGFTMRELLTKEQCEEIDAISLEIEHIRSAAEEFIVRFAQEFAQEYSEALTRRAERMLRHHERESIEEFISTGVIDEEDAAKLRSELVER